MHQIKEDDLAELERALPLLLDEMYPLFADPDAAKRLNSRWGRVREIVTDIRWNYGPPMGVVEVPDH